MNVAIFYDEKKKDAAMAIKNIIISHECDVTLFTVKVRLLIWALCFFRAMPQV